MMGRKSIFSTCCRGWTECLSGFRAKNFNISLVICAVDRFGQRWMIMVSQPLSHLVWSEEFSTLELDFRSFWKAMLAVALQQL